ncbi:MAG: response regulator [Spirochaetales bacterium]|nr:response regulator [Spirochaetales bacterium]
MEKTKIIICVDEPVNLEFFDITLSKLGFNVIKALDGIKLLEKVKETKPDIIIIDNKIPKLTGWEAVRLLKHTEEYSSFSDIPVIMLSDEEQGHDKVDGLELGVEDYIIKPFRFSEVYARIRNVVKARLLAKQVLAREQRLAAVESLNGSLKYFTEHIKKPMSDVREICNTIDIDNIEAVKNFIARIKEGSEAALAAIEGLEEEINEIETTDDLDFDITSIADLEDKFKKRYKTLKVEKN